ncbi:MAG: serine/threonine protein phosphatase [Planctomycetia bacterium]|nr:serine/threonine protein phosphatase [Planctomycetia bacterium]
MAGRTLAIGDIHGCDVAFNALLKALSIAADDTVVVLGDAVDRGPGSRQVIERLMDLQNECRLVFILGNHEEMMLEGLEDEDVAQGWLQYGGAATLFSYGGDPRTIPPEHLDFLRAAVPYWETERDLFLHANVDPTLPLDQQEIEVLRWTHLTEYELPHPSGKRIICGHTPQRSGVPLTMPGWVCIDTFVCGGGWLTCLDVNTNDYCQTNFKGHLRFGRLEMDED